MKVEQSKTNRRLVDSNYQFYSQQPDALANCATEADFTEAQPKLSPKSSFKTRAACIDAISSRQSYPIKGAWHGHQRPIILTQAIF